MNEAACSQDELKALFHIRAGESASDTHDHLQCDCLDHMLTSAEEAERKKQQMMEDMTQGSNQHTATDAHGQADSLPAPPEDGPPLEDLSEPAPSPAPSDGSDSEPERDADDDDGFIVEDGDGDSDDFEDQPQRRAAGKAGAKKKKKEAKARRSLKTSLVLDPLQLSSIIKAMIGQRGSPPEEELINWAHHITGMSAPDPLLRQALSTMNRTKQQQQYVSFIFSCEVKGKQIGLMTAEADDDDGGEEVETAETKAFAQFSARCSLPPVQKEKTTGVLISADDALEKHRKMMEEHEKKRKKRLGLRDDDGEGRAGGGHSRRHSSRLTTRQNLSEDALAAEQMDGEEGRRKRGEDAAAGGLGVGAAGELVDPAVLADADPETAAMIQAMLRGDDAQDGSRSKRKRGGKKEKPAKLVQPEPAADEEDDMLDLTPLQLDAPQPHAPNKGKEAAGRQKEREEKEQQEDDGAADDDEEIDSSVEVLSVRREKVRPVARVQKPPPAMPNLPKLPVAVDDDDFFI